MLLLLVRGRGYQWFCGDAGAAAGCCTGCVVVVAVGWRQ